MEAEQRSAAKEQMIALMQAGHRWQEASAQAGHQVSRSTAYRLQRQVRSRGKAAFEDGRHGHPAKLRTDERAWLETYCHTSPGTLTGAAGKSGTSSGSVKPAVRSAVSSASSSAEKPTRLMSKAIAARSFNSNANIASSQPAFNASWLSAST